MSDFDKTELGYHQEGHDENASVQKKQEDNKVSANIGNFDDFERLDGAAIEETQHQHHIERDFLEEKFHHQGKGDDFDFSSLSSATHTTTTDVAFSDLISTDIPPSSTANILDLDDDKFAPIPMQRESSPSNLEIKSVHSSSTDRPLVTLPSDSDFQDNYSFNYQSSATTVPETTELHLTPDPDDKLGFGLNEPFVNVIGVDKLETEPKSHSPNIYPGKLYAQGGYSVNPAHLDEDDDEQIVEEEGEDNLEFKGPSHLGLESGPDVLHPSAPDLISNPYQTHQQEEEEFSELNREDSPPPRYELTEDRSKFSTYIDNDKEQSHYLDKEEHDDKKFSSVTKVSEEAIETLSKTVKKEVEITEKESCITTTAVSSKIEELIEELTPPFAACPSAACKMDLAKREEAHNSVTTENACMFHPRAWFNPEKLDPKVADLIYWRDVKKSGIAFGAGLVILLSLSYFSLISVVAYLLLTVMGFTLSYRIYKNVLQAVQKSSEGHPFKQYLDIDLTLSREKVRDASDVMIKHLDCTANSLRRLFLVEDLVDSLKFAVVLWCFTYIGSWFNGLTLVILAFVSMFTLPKVYETYKAQIDHYLHLVCSQVDDVMNKVKAKIPIGKKPKQQ